MCRTDDFPPYDSPSLEDTTSDELLALDRESRMQRDREIVDCDQECGAFAEPETFEETKAALEHWQNHGYLSGCSHAC